MQTLWFTFTGFYAIALAFASGTLTGHLVVGRTAVGGARGSDAVLGSLFQWTALVGVGLVSVFVWRWWQAHQTTGVTTENHQRAASPLSAVVPSADASVALRDSSTVAATRGSARAAEIPIESLLTDSTVSSFPGQRAAQAIVQPISPAVLTTAAPVAVPFQKPADRVVPPLATTSPAPRAAASRARDQRPRTVRKGYLFAPRIIWGVSRSRIMRAWLIAGFTAAASAGLLFAVRNTISVAQILVVATVVAAVTLGPLAQTLVSTAASRRLGRRWVHMGTSPAAPESEVSGTIWLSNQRLRAAVRARQLIRPANVRLFCVRGPQSAALKRLDTDTPVWRHDVAVRADRMTFMTRRLGIPFRFDLPVAIAGMSLEEQDSLVWMLSVETTMNGLELSEQFVLPPQAMASASTARTDETIEATTTEPLTLARRAR